MKYMRYHFLTYLSKINSNDIIFEKILRIYSKIFIHSVIFLIVDFYLQSNFYSKIHK